jgi:hypothetical protein
MRRVNPVVLAIIVGDLAVIGIVAFVAIHFIRKFW